MLFANLSAEHKRVRLAVLGWTLWFVYLCLPNPLRMWNLELRGALKFRCASAPWWEAAAKSFFALLAQEKRPSGRVFPGEKTPPTVTDLPINLQYY